MMEEKNSKNSRILSSREKIGHVQWVKKKNYTVEKGE